MKVHITGGKGFLGGYAADALSDHEVEISDVDTLDICDFDAVVAKMATSKPDVVLHLAGLTGANPSLKDPHRFFEVGTTGTLHVLEACRRAGVESFVFLSSLTVHGQTPKGEVVTERSPLAPRHPYAGAKAAAEAIVETYGRCYDLRCAILRPTLIAGEGQKEPNAITEFADTVARGESIELFGDGSHKREWLHPSDVGTAMRAAVEYVAADKGGPCETFLISSGAPISMADLAEKVIAAMGKGQLVFTPSTRQAFDLCTDSTRARTELGWQPALDVDAIIQRVLAMR